MSCVSVWWIVPCRPASIDPGAVDTTESIVEPYEQGPRVQDVVKFGRRERLRGGDDLAHRQHRGPVDRPRMECDSTLPSGPPIGHPVGQNGVVPDAIRRCRHRRPITVAVM
jgi:hypothetical protein